MEYRDCCPEALLWFVQLEDRRTGRLIGKPEMFVSQAEACERIHLLEMESEPDTTDVVAWQG
jgi:hypothetical protein